MVSVLVLSPVFGGGELEGQGENANIQPLVIGAQSDFELQSIVGLLAPPYQVLEELNIKSDPKARICLEATERKH